MKKSHKKVFPEDLYIYVRDYDGLHPVFAATENIDECDDGAVASYKLACVNKKTTVSVIE